MALSYNDTHKNILVSYEYMRKNLKYADFVFQLHKDKKINLMIDSGAFSVYNKKSKPLNVKDYCDFLKDYHEWCNKYVMLDVIGSQKETEINYFKMLKSGLNPMYVCTMHNKDFSLVKDAVKNNPYICVAGGYTSKGDWTKKRYQDVYKLTEGKADIHGLAYVYFKDMLKLPLESVDSSSWTAGKRFGTMSVWNGHNGMIKTSLSDIKSGKKKVNGILKETFYKREISPLHFKDKKYMKGNNSFMFFLDVMANIEYQKYLKRHGLNYFLACSNKQELETYLKCIDNPNVTYQQWRDL